MKNPMRLDVPVIANLSELAIRAVSNPTLANMVAFSVADRDSAFYAPQKPSIRLPKNEDWYSRLLAFQIYNSTVTQCRMAVWESICRTKFNTLMWGYDENMDADRYLHPLMYLGDDQRVLDEADAEADFETSQVRLERNLGLPPDADHATVATVQLEQIKKSAANFQEKWPAAESLSVVCDVNIDPVE